MNALYPVFFRKEKAKNIIPDFIFRLYLLTSYSSLNIRVIENLDQRYLYPLLEQFGEKSPRPGLNPRPPAP